MCDLVDLLIMSSFLLSFLNFLNIHFVFFIFCSEEKHLTKIMIIDNGANRMYKRVINLVFFLM